MVRFVAAAVQAAPVWLNRAATTDKACRLIREASELGARVVAFPESFIPAFPFGVWHHGVRRNMRFYQELTESAVALDGPEVAALQSAAREAQCAVVMGVTERDGGSLFNAQLFFGADGALLGRRRKLKPTSAERLVWGEGDGAGLRVFDTGETGRLGGLICGEHNLALARFTMQSQQEQLHVASHRSRFEKVRPPCLRTAPHPPPWTIGAPGPPLRTPGAPPEPLGRLQWPQGPLSLLQRRGLVITRYPDPVMEGRAFYDRVDAAVRQSAAELVLASRDLPSRDLPWPPSWPPVASRDP